MKNDVEIAINNIWKCQNISDNIKWICQYTKWPTIYVKDNMDQKEILQILYEANELSELVWNIRSTIENTINKVIRYDDKNDEYIDINSLFTQIKSLSNKIRTQREEHIKEKDLLKLEIKWLKKMIKLDDNINVKHRKVLTWPFKELQLPLYIINILIRNNIMNIDELIHTGRSKILMMPRMGTKTYMIIKKSLRNIWLDFIYDNP